MKPSKKQSNIKKTNNDSLAPKIEAFFKAAPKSFVVDKANVPEEQQNGDKQFYIDLLKNKLQSKYFVSFFAVNCTF